jgi:membrane-associated phospholipid phosphatase
MIHPTDYLADSRSDIARILKESGQLFYRHRRILLLLLLLALLLAALILPLEMDWLHTVQGQPDPSLRRWAKRLSFWGDWYTGSLIFCGLVWLAGWIKRQGYLRQAALGCLLAALLSGLFSDVFRYGLGRARPNAGFAPGLYGPSLQSRFHSFPSGHTTTAFGTAVATAVLFPPLSLPALTLAGGVAWSRLYLNYHHPSDILMGCVVGSSFGVVFGAATRRSGRKSGCRDGQIEPQGPETA